MQSPAAAVALSLLLAALLATAAAATLPRAHREDGPGPIARYPERASSPKAAKKGYSVEDLNQLCDAKSFNNFKLNGRKTGVLVKPVPYVPCMPLR